MKYLIALVVGVLLFPCMAGAGEKEELEARGEALMWKIELLKKEAAVLDFIKANNDGVIIKRRLEEIDKKTKDERKDGVK
jgi:hypothetical protein